MVKDEEMKDTTIARYIARFRSESPCPRNSREKLKEKFWWLQKTQEENKENVSEKNGSSSKTQAGGTHLTTTQQDPDEKHKVQNDKIKLTFDPINIDVSSSIQSLYFDNDADEMAVESLNSWDFRSQNDEHEEDFEDPEVVIKRVRERLGLSHDGSQFLSGPLSLNSPLDSPASSHIPSPQYVTMNLNDLEEINPVQSPVPSHISEPLSLNTSIHSFSSSSVHSVINDPTQQTPPNSARSSQFHLSLDEKDDISSSGSLQLEEKPTGRSSFALSAFSPNEPLDSPFTPSEKETSISMMQEQEHLDQAEEMLPPPLPPPHTEESEEDNKATDYKAADEPSLEKPKLNFELDMRDLPQLNSPDAPSMSPPPSSCSSSSSSSSSSNSESYKPRSGICSRSSSRSNSFSSLPPRSPTIPSLSSAKRSSSHKVFRGSTSSVGSTSPISPASEGPPEDPETEQTVDGLVSFVVQSWSEPNTPQPSPLPAVPAVEEIGQKEIVADVPTLPIVESMIEDDVNVEELFKNDPVAQLLIKRINLLEKALEKKQSTNT